MRSTPFGSIDTPWSPDPEDRSPVRIPSSRISTRSLSKPRMIGRLAPGPKLRLAMPGSFRRKSPRVPAESVTMSNESRVETALNVSKVVSVPPTEADTVTLSRIGERPSTKFTSAVSPASTVTTCRPAVRFSRWASASQEPARTFSSSNAPCSSVSAKPPEPITRTAAPRTGSPFCSNVTVPRTAPVSCARTGAASAAVAANAAKHVAIQRYIDFPFIPSSQPFTKLAPAAAAGPARRSPSRFRGPAG